MPASQADWEFIKRRWEEGLSAPAIEKEIMQPSGKPAVSRQAILKRARKDGWLRGVERTHSLVVGSSGGSSAVPAEPAAELSDPSQMVALWAPALTEKLSGMGKTGVNERGMAKALQSYALGGNHTMAAAFVGVSTDTWARWREDCPELVAAIGTLHAANAAKHLGRIDAAGRRGDWKADEAVLKANPLTKQDWREGDKGGGVNIQVNFAGVPAEALKVIDG